MAWYEGLFSGHTGQRAIGEASNSYTYPMYEEAIPRIRRVLGGIRLIYVVREPVSRTHSHFLYYQHYAQTEHSSFAEAVHANPIYLGASDYPRWIGLYRTEFGPESLHVVLYDDLVREPTATVQGIYRFLGVEPSWVPKSLSTRTNATFVNKRPVAMGLYKRLSRSALRRAVEAHLPHHWRARMRNLVRSFFADEDVTVSIEPDIRRELGEHFAAMILDLELLLGRDLSAWRSER
jgi:hypothetical protein